MVRPGCLPGRSTNLVGRWPLRTEFERVRCITNKRIDMIKSDYRLRIEEQKVTCCIASRSWCLWFPLTSQTLRLESGFFFVRCRRGLITSSSKHIRCKGFSCSSTPDLLGSHSWDCSSWWERYSTMSALRKSPSTLTVLHKRSLQAKERYGRRQRCTVEPGIFVLHDCYRNVITSSFFWMSLCSLWLCIMYW